MIMSNLFINTAQFYDLDCLKHHVVEDLPLYRTLAAQQDGAVLELACGTGRVALDLAEKGFEVWAVDVSEPMLDQLQAKISRLPAALHSRVHVSCQDMRTFELGRQFALIIIPYRSFQALLTPQEARDCLQRVKRHLAPGGLFVFDILRNSEVMWSIPPDVELPDWEDVLGDTKVIRTNRLPQFDRQRNIFAIEHIYRLRRDNAPDQVFKERLDLKMYSEDEIGGMLLASGLQVRKTLLDYDGKNLGGSADLIFIAEHVNADDADERR